MDYRKTLNLPRTDFPMKANLPQKEPEIIKKWDEINLYSKILEKNKDRKSFVMHDGPPYANGRLHDGTILNKILKDITVKYRNMSGRYSTFKPGWDCHGLPIELKVSEKLGSKKSRMTTEEFLGECRSFAAKAVDVQKSEFKRLGVLARWDEPYLTMNPEYESQIAHKFADVIESGALVLAEKPVQWCPSCGTALAEAEVEYAEHESPSIYVKFPLTEEFPGLPGEKVSFVIWTTTPWTIPANLAIALGERIEYCAVKYNGEVFIVAEDLRESFLKAVGHSDDAERLTVFRGNDFKGLKTAHPFEDRESLIIFGDHVTLDAGTGCVHTAPGHGAEDYIIGLEYGLDVYAPVDDRGRFTEDVSRWSGLNVFKANKKIVDFLDKTGFLLNKPGETVLHSYPHCWRCHKPVIFRATEQWFISMDKTQLRKRALENIKDVELIPEWGRKRITPMLENAPNWCVSRQRLWGTPIIAFVCKSCGEKMVDSEIAHSVADKFAEHNIEIWHREDASFFIPEGTVCEKCGGNSFDKVTDTLDVWFDSGVSWAGVLSGEKGLEYPADLYLEGSDQHRGWFQSSLKLSTLINDKAPYRTVLTHGFVVDEKGEKLSKSKGNFTPPEKRIKQLGAEILRMWVSGEDYRDDIRISDSIIKSFATAYRKVRNTIRFMLGFINDFEPSEHIYSEEDLSSVDKWAIAIWKKKLRSVINRYESYEYHKIFHSLLDFLTVDMSSVYLDIIKDRYVMKSDDERRRKSQFAVYRILEDIIKVTAPIFSFTSEEAYTYLPGNRKESVFLEDMPSAEFTENDRDFVNKWELLLETREGVQRLLEKLREDKVIGHSLDASVKLYWKDVPVLDEEKEYLESIFIVSEVCFDDNSEGLVKISEENEIYASVDKAPGKKCERCWKKRELKNYSDEITNICPSCYEAIK